MTRPGRDAEASPGLRFAPLAAYLLVYTGTCLVGAAVLLSGYRPFVALYEYFSGSRVPSLTTAEKETALALLLASPVLTAAGFTAATRRLRPATHRPADTWARRTGLVAFAICASAALAELIRAGAFSHLASWLDYGDWVVVRETLFRRIGFAGFADIYVLVPTSAAWVVASELHRGKRGLVVSLAACATAAALSLLLFQKRPALAAAIIVVTAALLSTRHRVSRRSIGIRTLVAASMLVLVYFALLVVPVVSKTSKTIHQAVTAQRGGKPALLSQPQREQRQRLAHLGHEIGLRNRTKALILYSALAPLTRTSAAALYYPHVFPREHPLYGLDLGQDVLGIGAMPDDNIVVWNAMNPTEPGGNVAAPYQFPLYSQIGLAGSLIGSLVVGLLVGLLWRVAVSRIRGREAASAFGALVVLLAIYLAIDSARNSILVSYGVIWGIGALGLMVTASSGARYGARRYRHYRAQRRTASASTASSRSA